MKLTEATTRKLASFAKQRLLAKYDPSTLVPSLEASSDLEVPHKGLYIGLKNIDESILRVGFLEEDCSDIISSINRVIEGCYTELAAKSVPSKVVQSSTVYCTVVYDVIFAKNALSWNENEDGVYFSWGDKFKGLYLPYQIKQMAVKKSEIMNRLCSWEAGVPSNLWRLPEGLTHRLVCESFASS